MIIRHPASRQSRRLFWRVAQRSQRRWLATEADLATSTSGQTSKGALLPGRGSNDGTSQSSTTSPVEQRIDTASLAAKYLRNTHIRETTSSFGAAVEPHYRPTNLLTHPPAMHDITIELLLASQTHLGHATSLWNPANSRYIFGIRQGIHIISLDVTAAHLRRAARIVSGVAQRGGLVLFVGNRPGFAPYVVRAAKMSGQYHVFDRWVPGTLSNATQTLANAAIMAVDAHDQPVPGLREKLATYPIPKPDLIVCLNPLENYIMLQEAANAGIPTVGVIDTDADPTWVTYPIPANDDALRSIGVIVGVLGNAAAAGRAIRLEKARQGIVEYEGVDGLSLDEEEPADEEDEEGLLDVEDDVEDASITPDQLDAAVRRDNAVSPQEPARRLEEAQTAPQPGMGANAAGEQVAEHVRAQRDIERETNPVARTGGARQFAENKSRGQVD